MKILLIEPYLSASHKQWLSLLANYLPFEVQMLSLPGRHWKWRMHHSAIEMAGKLAESNFTPDLFLVSDMMDVALFRSLTYQRWPAPIALYFHENQITYPWSDEDQDEFLQRDNHYGFTNYTSARVADHVIFNSKFHLHDFVNNLGPFLGKFPGKPNKDIVKKIERKSSVIAPAIDIDELNECQTSSPSDVPTLLWNHRWDYDKDPNLFFSTLREMKEENLSFNLVILGEDHKKAPREFVAAKDYFADRLLHFGFAPNRTEYLKWLWKSDLVLSTSKQDFFGISVVEAIYCGCFPLLPNRLAFPEHIPAHLMEDHLYDSEKDLKNKLRAFLTNWKTDMQWDEDVLRQHVSRYDIKSLVPAYANLFYGITQIKS